MNAPTTLDLWRHILGDFGDATGYLCVAALDRTTGVWQEDFYAWLPGTANFAADRMASASRAGKDAYACCHLLKDKQRRKAKALDILTLWFELDGGEIPAHLPRPTARVESSPGRTHNYLRLTRRVAPEVAENFNRRLTHAAGGDPSGYDLTQVFRVPDTVNFKYPERPAVRLLYIEDRAYDPDELDRLLPPAPRDDTTGRAATGAPIDCSGDEPPVLLGARGMEWWTGARYCAHPDGSRERSKTLFTLGAILVEANASDRLVAGALADRDAALGINKYCGRPDAARRYAVIARRARQGVAEEGRHTGGTPPMSGDDCPARLARLTRDLAERDAALARLAERLRVSDEAGERMVLHITRIEAENAALEAAITHPDQAAGVGALDLVEAAERAYHAGDVLTVDGKDYARIPYAKAARRRAAKTLSRGLKSLAGTAPQEELPRQPVAFGREHAFAAFARKERIETPTFKGDVDIAYLHIPPDARGQRGKAVLGILPPCAGAKKHGGRRTIPVPPEVAAQPHPVRRERELIVRWYDALSDAKLVTETPTRRGTDYWTAGGEQLLPEEVERQRVAAGYQPPRPPAYRPPAPPTQTPLRAVPRQDADIEPSYSSRQDAEVSAPPVDERPGLCTNADCGRPAAIGGFCEDHYHDYRRRHAPAWDYAAGGG